MKDKMKWELERGLKEDVVKEYIRLLEKANKKIPTKTSLNKLSKEQLINKCVTLRNRIMIFG